MALEEVSFYNVNGDEINLTNLVSQMINYYEQKLEVGETRITDFNEGSEIRNLLEAFAILGYAIMEEQVESTKISFISLSYGDWLDRIGELPFIDLERQSGNVSSGSVTFTLEAPLSDNFTIPADTLLSSSETELDFTTLYDCIILAGETSATAPCECLTEGTDGNVPAESIDTIEDDTIDTEIVSVSNEYAFELGMDYEEDEEYRERLLANVQADGFGSMGYYQSLGENVTGVHDIKLVSDETHTRKVLVNGYKKSTPDSVLLDVLTVYSSLENLVLGHSFTVDRPVYDEINLDITLSVATPVDEDMLKDNLEAFFDGTSFDRMEYTGLHIDEELSRDKIISAFNVFPEVLSVDSILLSNEEVTMITPSMWGVLQLKEINFTQNEGG